MRRQQILSLLGLLTQIPLLLPAQTGWAHGRSVSYSSWSVDSQGADVSLRLKLLELSRLGPEALPPGSLPQAMPSGHPDRMASVFPTELTLLADGAPCPPTSPARRRGDAPGWVRYAWRVECPAGQATRLTVRSSLLLSVAPGHLHFVRVRNADPSSGLIEQVLTEAAPELTLRSPEDATRGEPRGGQLRDYVRLGIEHILSGWDHLAFVFGLLLLAGRLGEVARLVTGFTLAHSITLALAVLDFVHPRAAAVEAVIAFSVALVAIEKGWLLSGRNRMIPRSILAVLLSLAIAAAFGWVRLPVLTLLGLALFSAFYFRLAEQHSSAWLRVCLTFAFGLVHGFGFAGILMEMALPADRLVPALLGFNLGVELGQIGVVLLLWPILQAGQRWSGPAVHRLAGELSAAALCGIGIYWFAERALSG